MELEGLTAIQVKLCDSLWECESLEDVEEFIAELPAGLQKQARSLQWLMLYASIDDDVETEKDCKQAQKILQEYTKPA